MCPAAMTRSALLYAEKGYAGNPVRLKPGLYRNISDEYLSGLGSVDLPDAIEAVFFTEPDFQGEALAQRDDLAEVPDVHQKIGSLVVLDRSHYRQNYIILFEEPGFKGRAQLLVLPEHWQKPEQTSPTETSIGDPIIAEDNAPAFARQAANLLPGVGSVWIPPGVAIDILSAEGNATLRGDISELPADLRYIQPRRDKLLQGSSILTSNELYGDVAKSGEIFNAWGAIFTFDSNMKRWLVPEDLAVFLFENEQLNGNYEVIVGGRDDMSHFGWVPNTFSFPKTPKGVDGVIAFSGVTSSYSLSDGTVVKCLGINETVVVPPGSPMPDTPSAWFPPEYCLVMRNGERIGANGRLDQYRSLKDGIVTRFSGVMSNPEGYGLTIDRIPSSLLNAPDELRFGGVLLRPENWYHLAQTWDGKTMRWILDGKVVQESNLEGVHIKNQEWEVGQGFRGGIAQLRVWNQSLPVEFIQKNRFPGADAANYWGNGQTPTPIAQPDLSAFVALPDAVLIPAALPASPEKTMLMQAMIRQTDAEHQQQMAIAHQEASALNAQALDKAQYKMAQAHEKARRDIHFNGLKHIAFTRGSSLLLGKPGKNNLSLFPKYNIRLYDLTINKQLDSLIYTDQFLFFASDLSYELNNNQLLFPKNPPILALASANTENLDISVLNGDNHIKTGLYFLEYDGTLYRTWGYKEDGEYYFDDPLALNLESDRILPGATRTWNLVVAYIRSLPDNVYRTRMYCTNGIEIYRGCDQFKATNDLSNASIKQLYFYFDIVIPHALSPNPVALDTYVVDKETTLVWIDAKDEVIRTVKILDDDNEEDSLRVKRPVDLYPAFNPAHSISLCKIPNPYKPEEEVVYIYWISGEKKILEAPILDTPGRYLDLYDDLSGPESAKQHVSIVETEEIVGTEWAEESFTLALEFRDPMVFGPFNIKEGLEITLRLNLDARLLDDNSFLSFNLADPWMIGYRSLANHHQGGSTYYNFSNPLPLGEWMDVKIMIENRTEGPCIIVYKDDQTLCGTIIGKRDEYDNNEIYFQLPALLVDHFNNGFPGAQLAEIVVRSAQDTVLAYVAANKVEGKVESKKKHFNLRCFTDKEHQPTDMPDIKKKVLSMQNLDEYISFSPVQMNLQQGWTATAVLIWEPLESMQSPVCVYELATFEGEDRLVCYIDKDGMPRLYFRWEGIVYMDQNEDPYDPYLYKLKAGEERRLTWMIDPNGAFKSYIDGRIATWGQLAVKPTLKVFEGHRLGIPCAFQDHHIVGNALDDQNAMDNQHFDGFTGKIIRFTAWNTYVPNAIYGLSGTPEESSSWDRSLITIESKRRYLRAGRLDGQEPPVTLFPIELDGPFVVESEMEWADAQHAYAHNQLAAAREYQAHQKMEGLKNAQSKLADTQLTYNAAQEKSRADISTAQEKADADISAESMRKANADLKAALTRSEGKKQVDSIKEDGTQKYNDKVTAASAEKNQRIADKEKERTAKRNELANKKAEYDNKKR